jgi:hypothetical protein
MGDRVKWRPLPSVDQGRSGSETKFAKVWSLAPRWCAGMIVWFSSSRSIRAQPVPRLESRSSNEPRSHLKEEPTGLHLFDPVALLSIARVQLGVRGATRRTLAGQLLAPILSRLPANRGTAAARIAEAL